jgi:hypothetical protein
MLSYDAMCQYHVKLPERFRQRFPQMIPLIDEMRYMIPVLHLQDHQEQCEYKFGPYYMLGGAHYYGEHAESIWAEYNQVGGRTRQMTPGHRHDTLNEHHADWNWKKFITLRKQSLRQQIDMLTNTKPTALQLQEDCLTARELFHRKASLFERLCLQHADEIEKWDSASRLPVVCDQEVESVYRLPPSKGGPIPLSNTIFHGSVELSAHPTQSQTVCRR